MDPQRFDDLTKTLSTVRSRRGLLRTLGGVLGATGLAIRLGQGARVSAQPRSGPTPTCSSREAAFRDRFQSCFNDKPFCERPRESCCEFCTHWTGCTGALATGTDCGTVDDGPPCSADRPKICRGQNFHQDKCCPLDHTCGNLPSGEATCR